MPSNFKVSSDIDTFLRKQTRQEAADYLGLEIPPAVWGGITGTLSNQSDLQDALDANASGVATNSSNIATNAAGIATNVTGIATNATAITTERDRATAAEALLAPIADATFTGTTTIPSADITTADFNAGETDGGELSWNNTERTLNLATGADTTIQVGQETVMYCRNKTGTDILNGQVVKIVGAQGDTPDIELAIASNTEEAHRTLGVATQTISANSGKGFITLVGKVRGLDLRQLNGFAEGGLVYLSDTTAGALTPIKPEIEVEIGHALRLGQNNGTLGVFINNEAAVYELEQQVPHNSDSVVICNDGDNIQDKYDEAVALATGGLYGYADLIVMSGTYSSGSNPSAIVGTGNNNVSIIGVGNRDHIEIDGIILDQNYGLITNVKSNIQITSNYADIKGVYSGSSFSMLENYGDIIDCSATTFLSYVTNYGLIEGCESRGLNRGFGGSIGSSNHGTIKNCTAKGFESFGQQDADGVTENCTGVDRAFAGSASNLDFSGGQGVQGTYKNCVAGNLSFFGHNTTTNGVKTVEATYINCTAAANSFGFVNTVGAETHFSGKAIGCTSGNNGFFNSVNGNTKILNGAILENCIGGANSFARAVSSDNEGVILRCRTGTFGSSAFSVTGTGKVRLCLDGNYGEVNLG